MTGQAPMLVSTEWLAANGDEPGVVVVDMRWREDGSGRSRYERGHVPGARFIDWATDIVDPDGAFAFMLAPPARFAEALELVGVSDDSHVVAYADRHGSGPHRLWWACRVYGHGNVSILDGGYDKWKNEGRPVTAEVPSPPRGSWTASEPDHSLIADVDDVGRAAADPTVAVLDSRPRDQFLGLAVWFETGPIPAGPDGIAHTPRGDLIVGHVPGAASVPAAESLYRADFTMKSPEELRAVFADAGATPDRAAITYCGVAISASALLFAMKLAGFDDVRLYDGSWEEWGRDPSRPVARGEA